MHGSGMVLKVFALAAACMTGTVAARAETVMQQCGQQYQAAKAAGTLNGMTWTQFRTDCSAKLKAQPASASAPAAPVPTPVAPAPAAVPAPAEPATPEPTTAATPAPAATGGRAAFVARERQCGSEWRANKATLIAQTPGLTWPKYLSSCNKRLKAAGK